MLRGRVLRERVGLGGGVGRCAHVESAALRLRELRLWTTGRCIYHALAVCGNAFCEDGVAQFREVFLGQVAVCAFQQQQVQVRHGGGCVCGWLHLLVTRGVGVDVDVKLGGSAAVSRGKAQGSFSLCSTQTYDGRSLYHFTSTLLSHRAAG